MCTHCSRTTLQNWSTQHYQAWGPDTIKKLCQRGSIPQVIKMAKRFSVQTALQLIFEETEGFDGDAEETVSESEDNISENSESDTEFEEEDQHQPAPKRKRQIHNIHNT